MSEETRKKIDTFLTKRGYDPTELKTDKEVINKLRYIAMLAGIEVDYEYLVYDRLDKSNMSEEQKQQLVNDHLSVVHNFELIEKNANIYTSRILLEQKEERKLAKKQRFQKLLSIFKR